MTFRSPPPHRRMARQTAGKSEFQQTQDDLQKTVKAIGYDHLPVNDESLRPFLKHLWDFGKMRNHKVWTFDIPDKWPDRLFHGLMGSAVPLKRIADELEQRLVLIYSREEIDRARPVFTVGKVCICYFEGVWTPKAALRRH